MKKIKLKKKNINLRINGRKKPMMSQSKPFQCGNNGGKVLNID